MRVINLFGGPGAGKSTVAAGLFYNMKCDGHNVELVSEFAKQLVWQERHSTFKDQLYITAKQNHRMEILRDKVDFCITDSPLLLGIYYGAEYYAETFHPLVLDVFNGYHNINILLKRPETYDSVGRNQSTKEEAEKIDNEIINILEKYKIPYYVFPTNEKTTREISRLFGSENMEDVDRTK